MKKQHFISLNFIGVVGILILLITLLAIFTPEHNFIRIDNIKSLMSNGSDFAIVVLGVGLLMISGEFDLSVGSVLTFSSFVFMWLLEKGINSVIITIIVLICGMLTGLINGLITTKAKVSSFITTLSTMLFWRGITLIISKGEIRSFNISEYIFFKNIFNGTIMNFFPTQAIWFLVFMVILGFLLERHKFGNHIFATGDNENVARYMAINTDKVKIICFIIVGFLVAFSAIIQTVRITAFSPGFGVGLELRVIAAAVIGGTSLRGGRGNIIGIFLGAMVIIIIENALVIARLPYEWTYMAFGLITLFSIFIDSLSKKAFFISLK